MGYYSTIDITPSIVQFDENIFNNLNPYRGIITYSPKHKSFDADDFYGKWYDDRELAFVMALALKEGDIYMTFVGEDGYSWGYKITPGKVIALKEVCNWEEDDEETAVTEEYFKEFLDDKNKSEF